MQYVNRACNALPVLVQLVTVTEGHGRWTHEGHCHDQGHHVCYKDRARWAGTTAGNNQQPSGATMCAPVNGHALTHALPALAPPFTAWEVP